MKNNKIETKFNVDANGRVSFERVEVKKLDVKIKNKRKLAYLKAHPEKIEAYLATCLGQMGPRGDVRSINNFMSWSNETDLLGEKDRYSVLTKYLERFDVAQNKRPTDQDLGDWIGVEIECLLPVCVQFSDIHDLRHFLKREKMFKNVTVKSDGSISTESGYFGVEFAIVFNRNDRSELVKLCQFLANFNAKVNKSCGLHVHLDCRDLIIPGNSRKTLGGVTRRANNIGRSLGGLSRMVPSSRLNNRFCKLGVSGWDGERYFAVNKVAFDKYKTVEVRLHSSTTDLNKINKWIDILFKLSRARVTCETSEQLINCEIFSQEEKEYIKQRVAIFNPSESRMDDEDRSLAA